MHLICNVYLFLLQYCLSDEPVIRAFDPQKTCLTEYPITSFQPIYFLAESFADAKTKLMYDAENIIILYNKLKLMFKTLKFCS